MRVTTVLIAAVVVGALGAGVAAAKPAGLGEGQAACFDGIAKGLSEAQTGSAAGWTKLVAACGCAGTLREGGPRAWSLCQVVAEVEKDAAAAGPKGLPSCKGEGCFDRMGELKARTGSLALD
jgi:hypothetical protein